jgi:hypothetical protein
LARVTVEVPNFAALQAAVRERAGGRRGIAFRGYDATDKNEQEPKALMTGLERACKAIDGWHSDDARLKAPLRELAIIREFVRRAHHYLSDVPAKKNWLEWLALMQHHGAPTRLLDWTYSLHVATHFALWKASRSQSANLAIWMINTRWCLDGSHEACEALGKPRPNLSSRPITSNWDERASEELFDRECPLSVWPINPFRLNERLTLQKGVFLAPGQVTASFVANVLAIPGHDDTSNVARFLIPHSAIDEVGKELYDANVTEATLFPGLDGFARSLWTSARYLNISGLTSIYEI